MHRSFPLVTFTLVLLASSAGPVLAYDHGWGHHHHHGWGGPGYRSFGVYSYGPYGYSSFGGSGFGGSLTVGTFGYGPMGGYYPPRVYAPTYIYPPTSPYYSPVPYGSPVNPDFLPPFTVINPNGGPNGGAPAKAFPGGKQPLAPGAGNGGVQQPAGAGPQANFPPGAAPLDAGDNNLTRIFVRPSSVDSKRRAIRLTAQGDEWLVQKHNSLQAYTRYKQAAEIAPDVAEPRFRMGYTLVLMGEYSRAAQEFKRGLNIQPDWAKQGSSLDTVFGPDNELGKKSMLTRVAAWVQEDLRDPDRLFVMGVLLHFNEDRARAFTLFQTADLLAGSPPYLQGFLQADAHAGRHEQAGAVPQGAPKAPAAFAHPQEMKPIYPKAKPRTPTGSVTALPRSGHPTIEPPEDDESPSTPVTPRRPAVAPVFPAAPVSPPADSVSPPASNGPVEGPTLLPPGSTVN